MKAPLVWLALGMMAAGCHAPVCGTGTKEHQKANGDIECTPVDGTVEPIDCDADAGATIVGGKCISAISCGPNTELMNGVCVGTGGGGMMHVPQACAPPSAGKICINGVVRHLQDNSFLDGTEMVRVAVYDPLQFLANPTITPLAEMVTADTYKFQDVTTPALGLVAVAISDPVGTTPQILQITGTGGTVQSGMSYQIDTYATPKSLVDTWTSQAGVDYDAMGAYIPKYYLDAGPDVHLLTATETMPAAGVQVVQDQLPPTTRAKYFSTDLMTIGADTATTAVGTAILPGTGQSTPPTFTGSGGAPGDKWEHHPGDSTGHVVFVDRFHPCKQDTNGTCTN